jgi:hypothetical protein
MQTETHVVEGRRLFVTFAHAAEFRRYFGYQNLQIVFNVALSFHGASRWNQALEIMPKFVCQYGLAQDVRPVPHVINRI